MWLSFEGISSKKPVHTHQLPEAAQSDKMLLWGKDLTLNISLFQVVWQSSLQPCFLHPVAYFWWAMLVKQQKVSPMQ